MSYAPHAPVMEPEAIAALAPQNGGVYVDATFGGGGHSRAILAAANTTVYGFDRDPTAIDRASHWARAYGPRLKLLNRPFAEMYNALGDEGLKTVDGVFFDLGVSSMQLDEASRGFSIRHDGPLSMRMDKGAPDAADVVNSGDAKDLAAIFKTYGEERYAGRIARAVVAEREREPITTTGRLADIVANAAPAAPREKIHPATRVFQALRIFVNDELGQFVGALVAAEKLLRPAGRLVVITFHSLEDRIIKRFLVDRAGVSPTPSRHVPEGVRAVPTFRLLFAKPKTPSDREIADNPRARSAKLRAAIRLDAPARKETSAFAPPPLFLSKAFPRPSTSGDR